MKTFKIALQNSVLALFFFSIVNYGCKEADNPNIPAIGQIMEGGVVGHIFRSGEAGFVQGEIHGIIVAMTDLPTTYQWGCRGKEVGGTSREVGGGRTNTNAVIAFHDNLPNYYTDPTQCHPLNDGSVAAIATREYNNNGYDDWFMPTRTEAKILFDNKEAIGGFAEADYWSSCESSASDACAMSFVTGDMFADKKNQSKRVRVIRYF